jgi:threonine dehydratase
MISPARAEFPERPGALRKFLSCLRNMGWNISLFHYRNHGAGEQIFHIRTPVSAIWSLIRFTQSAAVPDLGKVLAGIQAPEEDSTQFSEFLRELGYPYVEETHNEVYKRYLRK